MELKLTFEDGSKGLAHYGVKGMKWGKHIFGRDSSRWSVSGSPVVDALFPRMSVPATKAVTATVNGAIISKWLHTETSRTLSLRGKRLVQTVLDEHKIRAKTIKDARATAKENVMRTKRDPGFRGTGGGKMSSSGGKFR